LSIPPLHSAIRLSYQTHARPSKGRPRAVSEPISAKTALAVVEHAIGEPLKPAEGKNPHAQALSALGASKGGKARVYLKTSARLLLEKLLLSAGIVGSTSSCEGVCNDFGNAFSYPSVYLDQCLRRFVNSTTSRTLRFE